MTFPRKLLALLLGLAVLLGTAGPVLADDEDGDEKDDEKKADASREGRGKDRDHEDEDDDRKGRPEWRKHDDKYLLHNDRIAVWFHANEEKAKPDLRIAVNGTDGNVSGYRVKILRLYEAPPDDPLFKGSYNKINLAKSDDWNLDVEQTNDSITLTMVRAERQGIVTLVWRIDTHNATVKYDLKVDNWRWANESHQLVLDMVVVGKNVRNETGASVSVEDAGYITWETTAQATYGANDTRTLSVQAYRKVDDNDDGEDDEDEEKTKSHILLVFNGTGGYDSLDYDPTFGVASAGAETRSVPGFAPALAAVALAGGALAAGRRRG